MSIFKRKAKPIVKDSNTLYFSDVKIDILAYFEKNIVDIFPGEGQKYIILEGFFDPQLHCELTESATWGGTTVPMVGVLDRFGRIQFFALKQILPNLPFYDEYN